MIAREYDSIINIGSVTNFFGYAGLAPYGASRGAVRQLTINAYLDSRKDLNKTTMNRYRGTMSMIFQEAIRNGKAETNHRKAYTPP